MLDRKLLELQSCATTLNDEFCQQKLREAKEESGEIVKLASQLK